MDFIEFRVSIKFYDFEVGRESLALGTLLLIVLATDISLKVNTLSDLFSNFTNVPRTFFDKSLCGEK